MSTRIEFHQCSIDELIYSFWLYFLRAGLRKFVARRSLLGNGFSAAVFPEASHYALGMELDVTIATRIPWPTPGGSLRMTTKLFHCNILL